MGREFDSDDLEPGRVNVADVAVAGSREETTLIFGKYSKTPLLLLFLLQLLLLCLLPPPMRTYIFQHTKYIYRVSIEPRDPPLLLLEATAAANRSRPLRSTRTQWSSGERLFLSLK